MRRVYLFEKGMRSLAVVLSLPTPGATYTTPQLPLTPLRNNALHYLGKKLLRLSTVICINPSLSDYGRLRAR